jgi:hypothetical protein
LSCSEKSPWDYVQELADDVVHAAEAAARTHLDGAVDHGDGEFSVVLRIDVEDSPAHADRGRRRIDLIGVVAGVAGDEAERALGQIDDHLGLRSI